MVEQLNLSPVSGFKILIILAGLILSTAASAQRTVSNFNKGWRFHPGNEERAKENEYDDRNWRSLDLPHDWSIEGAFSESHPTTFNQGALPAGIGWYRKTFIVPQASKGKRVYIHFDGVHRNSEVWMNGHYLGKRPNGYISFRYELTPYLKFGKDSNVIAVKVDDSAQPASRWYTGSGIYRNVWLELTHPTAVAKWGSYVTASFPNGGKVAMVHVKTDIGTSVEGGADVRVVISIYDRSGKLVARKKRASLRINNGSESSLTEDFTITQPVLWSPQRPVLYKAVTQLVQGERVIDQYETSFGIRYFRFDPATGFYLNGDPLKILGVCMHHDLGALGAAVNKNAMERQLRLLKEMGCNAIRTAHNPPAPEFLDLCDRMGFLVMDEAFDMWKKKKNKFDYSIDFADWHKQDLEDQVRRDRNHPSVFVWSIGNEIREQFDSTGTAIAKELVRIVKCLDTTRPVTSALTENVPGKNFIYQSGALDVLGFNYKLDAYGDLPNRFPGLPIIATETASALATRGHYDMPSDSNRLWPPDSKPFTGGNRDYTVSAYDHVYAYWGATHEQSWNAVKKYPHIAGCFVWSGFDFIGEPVPYRWPARSAYYGIVDLAGFPKDVYYMYQSEWTSKPVLHLFPHWNWSKGQEVDVWAYYNQADEVELFLNGKSLGTKKKGGDSLHVMWRVAFEPGALKAVSRKNGRVVLTKELRTAGQPFKIQIVADKSNLVAKSNDLSFIKVTIVDEYGNLVPSAENVVKFRVSGPGFVAGVDNGNPVSMESFKGNSRKAFNGKCLLVVGAKETTGKIVIEAASTGLQPAITVLRVD